MSPAHRVIDPGNLECARCHRPMRLATREPTPARGKVLTVIRRWPDGMICSGCTAAAQETFGTCPGCHTHRMLPGRNPTGQPCCTDCAGMPAMVCTRCGAEGWMEQRGVCGRCVLTDRLTDALDDGTGRIRPELTALADRLAAMPRPRTGILWLNKPHVTPVLHAIATGQVPLTHDGLTTLQPAACVSYVRKLLVAAGTLPDYDHHLDRFERWLPGWLTSIANTDQRAILTRYATWHLLRHLRNAAAKSPLDPYRQQTARHQARVAATFLTWLDNHQHTLETCTQALLDSRLASTNYSDTVATRTFLTWAIRARVAPRLTLPPPPRGKTFTISQAQRLQVLRRLLSDDTMPTADRVIGTLILLYAQSLQRILALRTSDITTTRDDVTLTLPGGNVPVPAPFDALLRAHLAERAHQLPPAANPDSDYLFPGRLAGLAIQPNGVRQRLQNLGIPNAPGRCRALRELVLQAPPALIAPLLGFNTANAEKIAAEAGNTWQHYAPGDHTRLAGNR